MEAKVAVNQQHKTRPARSTWDRVEPYLYMAPAVLFVAVFLLYPAVYTIVISLTKWDGLTPPVFVGLKNYIQIVQNPDFSHLAHQYADLGGRHAAAPGRVGPAASSDGQSDSIAGVL